MFRIHRPKQRAMAGEGQATDMHTLSCCSHRGPAVLCLRCLLPSQHLAPCSPAASLPLVCSPKALPLPPSSPQQRASECLSVGHSLHQSTSRFSKRALAAALHGPCTQGYCTLRRSTPSLACVSVLLPRVLWFIFFACFDSARRCACASAALCACGACAAHVGCWCCACGVLVPCCVCAGACCKSGTCSCVLCAVHARRVCCAVLRRACAVLCCAADARAGHLPWRKRMRGAVRPLEAVGSEWRAVRIW